MDAKTFAAAAGVSVPRAAEWAGPVTAAMAEFGIDTPIRQAAFIAQVGHESAGFAYTREIWGPTAAQLKYEGRADLGNTQKGDGSTYRGRGLIQITGRANYAGAGAALGIDLVRNPQWLESADLAARSAGWFWKDRDCNALADRGDFVGLTRKINGGTNGLSDRQMRWGVAKKALNVDTR